MESLENFSRESKPQKQIDAENMNSCNSNEALNETGQGYHLLLKHLITSNNESDDEWSEWDRD